jgi:hypothetical protein
MIKKPIFIFTLLFLEEYEFHRQKKKGQTSPDRFLERNVSLYSSDLNSMESPLNETYQCKILSMHPQVCYTEFR